MTSPDPPTPDIARIVAEHGHAIQWVGPVDPLSTGYAFTVGRHPHGPELILVGSTYENSAALLNALAANWHQLVVDGVHINDPADPHGIIVLDGPEGGWPIEYRPVHPTWTAALAPVAYRHHHIDPADLPMVQIVPCGPTGDLPRDLDDTDPAALAQPDLRNPTTPWRRVRSLPAEMVIWDDPDDTADCTVLVPITVRGIWMGEWEALPARRLDDDTAEIRGLGVSAGAALIGDIVTVDRWRNPTETPVVTGPTGPTGPVGTLATILRPGPARRLDYDVRLADPDDIDAFERVLARLGDTVRIRATSRAVHIASTDGRTQPIADLFAPLLANGTVIASDRLADERYAA